MASGFNSRVPRDLKEQLQSVSDRTGIDMSVIAETALKAFFGVDSEKQAKAVHRINPLRKQFRPMEQLGARWEKSFRAWIDKSCAMAGWKQVVVLEAALTDFLDKDDIEIMKAVRDLLRNEVAA